jgi:hypothetical protein
MNVRNRKPARPPTGWEIEVARFKALCDHWLEYRLNKLFDLTIRGPGVRHYWALVAGVGFVACAFIVHAILHYVPFLTPAHEFQLSTLPLFFFLTVGRLIIILFIPAYIAMTMAGYYLADIFELKDPTAAWDFIGELSLGGATEIIHIRDGKVSEESLNSPALLIGGPGLVLAEFDSAALFERADGTPHVIGLANAKPEAGKLDIILDGFERLREPIINLREQYIGNPSGEPITVTSRSLDGITVSAADVRGVFSLRRKTDDDYQAPSIQNPYVFNALDVENLIYKQAVAVLSEGPYSSGQPSPWTDTMHDLIRGSLSEFMCQNNLAEYLASIGAPEIELGEFREDTILSKTLQFSDELPDSTSPNITKPKFHPRTELMSRFTKSTDGFSSRAQERGLELHWIGVGTWKIPNEITSEVINDQHLEAWRINRENAARSSDPAIDSIADEAYWNEKIRLIQAVPLAAHEKNQAKHADQDVLIECLLQDYWEQIGIALEIYYKNGARSSELETIENAVLKIEKLLRIKVPYGRHFVGGGPMSKVRSHSASTAANDAPPAPTSRFEAEQYQILLSKLEGNYKVAEGMIANEARRYPNLKREKLIERIVLRFERYGR